MSEIRQLPAREEWEGGRGAEFGMEVASGRDRLAERVPSLSGLGRLVFGLAVERPRRDGILRVRARSLAGRSGYLQVDRTPRANHCQHAG